MSPRKILLSNDQWDMCDMKDSLAIGFCVHGYHVCNDIVAAIGGELPCDYEARNTKDVL